MHDHFSRNDRVIFVRYRPDAGGKLEPVTERGTVSFVTDRAILVRHDSGIDAWHQPEKLAREVSPVAALV